MSFIRRWGRRADYGIASEQDVGSGIAGNWARQRHTLRRIGGAYPTDRRVARRNEEAALRDAGYLAGEGLANEYATRAARERMVRDLQAPQWIRQGPTKIGSAPFRARPEDRSDWTQDDFDWEDEWGGYRPSRNWMSEVPEPYEPWVDEDDLVWNNPWLAPRG